MTDPAFDSRTARFGLPLLFAGQAQKEAFVNEVTARLDALLHGAFEGELSSPPALPLDGQCWLVGSSASGDWAGRAGQIAARQSGNWLFIVPRDGLTLLNRLTGQYQHFLGTWKMAPRPASPSGGSTIDAEARLAISAIVTALTVAGIIPAA